MRLISLMAILNLTGFVFGAEGGAEHNSSPACGSSSSRDEPTASAPSDSLDEFVIFNIVDQEGKNLSVRVPSPHTLSYRENYLGSGAGGYVVKAQVLKPKPLLFAVKLPRDASKIELIQQEVEFLSRVSQHPNIISVIGHCPEPALFMELCDTDLFAYAVGEVSIPEGLSIQKTLMKWCFEVSSAIAHLQKEELVHRDLKLENVLVTNSLVSKITDFDLACKAGTTVQEPHNYYLTPGYRGLESYGISSRTSDLTLTSHYVGSNYDSFSLGVLVYQLFQPINTEDQAALSNFLSPSDEQVALTKAAADGEFSTTKKFILYHIKDAICNFEEFKDDYRDAWSRITSQQPKLAELIESAICKHPDERPTAEDFRMALETYYFSGLEEE